MEKEMTTEEVKSIEAALRCDETCKCSVRRLLAHVSARQAEIDTLRAELASFREGVEQLNTFEQDFDAWRQQMHREADLCAESERMTAADMTLRINAVAGDAATPEVNTERCVKCGNLFRYPPTDNKGHLKTCAYCTPVDKEGA